MVNKYYWPILYHNVETYVQGCNICLASKVVHYKSYGDLPSLPVPTHHWKNFLMDFVTGLPLSANRKRDNYDSILIIVNCLIKMMNYKPVKITINTPKLVEVIIDVVVQHHNFPDSVINDQGAIFTSKFWSLLYHFLGIKWHLSIIFYPRQTGRKNNKTV